MCVPAFLVSVILAVTILLSTSINLFYVFTKCSIEPIHYLYPLHLHLLVPHLLLILSNHYASENRSQTFTIRGSGFIRRTALTKIITNKRQSFFFTAIREIIDAFARQEIQRSSYPVLTIRHFFNKVTLVFKQNKSGDLFCSVCEFLHDAIFRDITLVKTILCS